MPREDRTEKEPEKEAEKVVHGTKEKKYFKKANNV